MSSAEPPVIENASLADLTPSSDHNDVPSVDVHHTKGASQTTAVGGTHSEEINGKSGEVKIISRKINSFVGFSNLPKQWHRKSIRRGFNFNLFVVGESGLGKSTLVNTLFNREIFKDSLAPIDPTAEKKTNVTIETVDSNIQENGVQLNLTVISAPGFGDAMNNTNAWEPIVKEIDSRFDKYLESENRINRTTIDDDRVHALVYFIEPTGHYLKPLDITFMKKVHNKVNLIPVIAKSDILNEEEVIDFKNKIMEDIKYQGINIFSPPTYDNDDDETIMNHQTLVSKIPFAVVGSTTKVVNDEGMEVRGRSYPWGVIEIDNPEHCDFVNLRELLIREYLEELRETTSKVLYEKYRSAKLKNMGIEQDDSVFKEFDPVVKQQEEKALHQAKLAKMEAEMKAVFQQKVTEKEMKLQKSEAELFSRHKEMKEKLLKQVKMLEEKKAALEAAPRPMVDVHQPKTRKRIF